MIGKECYPDYPLRILSKDDEILWSEQLRVGGEDSAPKKLPQDSTRNLQDS
jgi:hypothetical protein